MGYFKIEDVLYGSYSGKILIDAPGGFERYLDKIDVIRSKTMEINEAVILNGDANGDCRVDMVDFEFIKQGFFKDSDDIGWMNSTSQVRDGWINADFNGDGHINT